MPVKKTVGNDHQIGNQERLFIEMWTTWGKPFNQNYSIRDRNSWNRFWDNCQYTEKQIYLALRNIHYACNGTYPDGIPYYESRYISPDPCRFIIGGMLERALSGDIKSWYEMDHPDWENPNSEYYDKNLQHFKD
jgi:hypothetical protein